MLRIPCHKEHSIIRHNTVLIYNQTEHGMVLQMVVSQRLCVVVVVVTLVVVEMTSAEVMVPLALSGIISTFSTSLTGTTTHSKSPI